MNILEAYISQFGYFNVIFSSVDHELLKEVVMNISKDFNAEFIDLFPIAVNMEDVDNERVKELTSGENKVKFLITPAFPSKYIKLGVSYHINISLNYKLINERNVNNEYVNLENKYKDQTIVNKYFNFSKYVDNNRKLEDDIFNAIILRITKRLDDGKYQEKVESEKQEKVDSKKQEKVDSEKQENSKKEFESETYATKKHDQDAKKKYLEEKNESFDEKILEEVSVSSEPLDSIEDNVTYDDVNMDDELTPTNDFSSMEPFEVYNQDGGTNKYVLGTRMLRKTSIIIGSRVIKKMNKK